MSQRRNYGFERRRKADVRQAKRESKLQRKTDRAVSGAQGPEMGERPEYGPQSGMHEWFSPSRGRTMTMEPGIRPEAGEPDDWMLLTDVESQAGRSGESSDP